MDCDFDRLDLSTNPYLEKNLEFLCNWIDDLSNEQMKFNQYARNLQRQKQDQARWLQKRKQTNDERRAAGDNPLPDEEFALDKKVTCLLQYQTMQFDYVFCFIVNRPIKLIVCL